MKLDNYIFRSYFRRLPYADDKLANEDLIYEF